MGCYTSAGSRTARADTAVRWPCCVKPNGLKGRAYMAAIKPFRHLLVYPRMLRDIERRWRTAQGGPAPAHA